MIITNCKPNERNGKYYLNATLECKRVNIEEWVYLEYLANKCTVIPPKMAKILYRCCNNTGEITISNYDVAQLLWFMCDASSEHNKVIMNLLGDEVYHKIIMLAEEAENDS